MLAVAKIQTGPVKSYSWMQTAGPAVILNDPNLPSPAFTAPAVSSDTILKFNLAVKDDKGAASINPAFVSIAVAAAPSVPNITSELPRMTNATSSGHAPSTMMPNATADTTSSEGGPTADTSTGGGNVSSSTAPSGNMTSSTAPSGNMTSSTAPSGNMTSSTAPSTMMTNATADTTSPAGNATDDTSDSDVTADTTSSVGNATADTSTAGGNATADTSTAGGNATADTSTAGGNATADTSTAGGNATADTSTAGGNATADTSTAGGNATADTTSSVGNATADTSTAGGNATSSTAPSGNMTSRTAPSTMMTNATAEAISSASSPTVATYTGGGNNLPSNQNSDGFETTNTQVNAISPNFITHSIALLGIKIQSPSDWQEPSACSRSKLLDVLKITSVICSLNISSPDNKENFGITGFSTLGKSESLDKLAHNFKSNLNSNQMKVYKTSFLGSSKLSVNGVYPAYVFTYISNNQVTGLVAKHMFMIIAKPGDNKLWLDISFDADIDRYDSFTPTITRMINSISLMSVTEQNS